MEVDNTIVIQYITTVTMYVNHWGFISDLLSSRAVARTQKIVVTNHYSRSWFKYSFPLRSLNRELSDIIYFIAKFKFLLMLVSLSANYSELMNSKTVLRQQTFVSQTFTRKLHIKWSLLCRNTNSPFMVYVLLLNISLKIVSKLQLLWKIDSQFKSWIVSPDSWIGSNRNLCGDPQPYYQVYDR